MGYVGMVTIVVGQDACQRYEFGVGLRGDMVLEQENGDIIV